MAIVKRGQTTNFVVFYDDSLGNGIPLADAVLAQCEKDLASLSTLFGGIMPATASLPFQIYLLPGGGGASHPGCLSTQISVWVSSGTDTIGAPLTVDTEVAEVLMNTQGKGFDCGSSNGEALSRVLPTVLYPTHDIRLRFSTGSSWLNNANPSRPDWVTNTEPTDRDLVSIGCGSLFLNYLAHQLNFPWTSILAAAAPTLGQTAANLGLAGDAFCAFAALLAHYYPPGAFAYLQDDNPFPLQPIETPGSVVSWGWNDYGQLGDAATVDTTNPVEVSGQCPGSRVMVVGGGLQHSLALTSDRSVWAWGRNDHGELGNGTTTDSSVPVAVSGLSVGPAVVAVAAGAYHGLALKSDGSVWAWGQNDWGQVGDGTTTDRLVPVAVSSLGSGVVEIAAGWHHSLALKSDGSVWAWGANPGDGSLQSTAPVAVTGLAPGGGVVAVAGGGFHSLALKSDGSVWAWGSNWAGELGDGTTTDRLAPVVGGLGAGSGVVAVAAGWAHGLALKSDGSVWAWGYNGMGQLGDDTMTTRLTPVAVSVLGVASGVVMIAGGEGHSLAIKSDGSAWAWGYNGMGQLGSGTNVSQSTPKAVTGISIGVVAVAAGGDHSLAVLDPNPLVSIAVTPANSKLAWGFNAPFQAAGTYADGSTRPLPGVTWSSSTAAATIDSTGLAHGNVPGVTTISATLGRVVGFTTLTVLALVSIAVTPANSSVGQGLKARFTATGTYSDGSTLDLTALCVWGSSNAAVAAIIGSGLVLAVTPGTTTISATLWESMVGSTQLTVAALVSIAVTPATSRLANGLSAQFRAIGTFSDGSTANLTGSCIWASSKPLIATISSTARAHALSPGTTTISATQGSVVGSTSLTIYLARIAFTSTRTGNPQIYVMNPDGSSQVRLTNNRGIDTTPSWSPDQTKIAFSATTGSPVGPLGEPQIFTMNADGTGVTQLTHSGQNTTPAWSPDGGRIAFTSTRDGSPQLYVMKADGSGQARLTQGFGTATTPSWSPDGMRIAFGGATATPTGPIGTPQILTMMANGTGVMSLTRNGHNTNPAWSPDGVKIAFASTRDGTPQVYVMHRDGSGQTRLTRTTGIDTAPNWSVDGKEIAFCSDRVAVTPQIFTMNVNGTGVKELTMSGQNSTPAWGSH
jgi:Tol biopolymer transport system component/alpha-tubulin suppressor-like RCC1 family protein